MNITKKDLIEYVEKYGTIFHAEKSYWSISGSEYCLYHNAGSKYQFDKHFNAKTKENCTLSPIAPDIEEITYDEENTILDDENNYIHTIKDHPIIQITGYNCACGEYTNIGAYIDMSLTELITEILAEKLGIERKIW